LRRNSGGAAVETAAAGDGLKLTQKAAAAAVLAGRFWMKREHSVDVVFTLALFAVFAVSVLLVLVSASKGYKSIAAATEREYNQRTALAYITAKVRHYDTDGTVSAGDFDGCNALILTEDYGGVPYHTYIYYYDGYIRELFASSEYTLEATAGFAIMPARALSFTMQDGMLSISCTDENGAQTEVSLAVRSGREADTP